MGAVRMARDWVGGSVGETLVLLYLLQLYLISLLRLPNSNYNI